MNTFILHDVGENVENERYLHTKADKLGHMIFD